MNYRLSQHATFPAQLEDCKAAIRWLRANADKYGYDASRIGVRGGSAGGHLVALLGTTGDLKQFDKGPHLDVSSRVQAVCDFYGPTDFLRFVANPGYESHADVKFHVIDDAGHGGPPFHSPEMHEMVKAFFGKHLLKKTASPSATRSDPSSVGSILDALAYLRRRDTGA